MSPGVNNTIVWADPRSRSQIDLSSFEHLARTAERGKSDFFFLAEGLRLREHNGRVHDLDVVGRPEPLTVLNAPAAVTEKLGLAARSTPPSTSRTNWPADSPPSTTSARARRARRRATRWSSRPGLRRGPGESAASTADIIFTRHGTLEAGREFYADVKGRLAAYGREGLPLRLTAIETTTRQSFTGSPATVAVELTAFVDERAADGFILVPHLTPGGLDDFVDRVVPLLQESGAFRSEYTGSTLRPHLGLPESVWKG